jgi:hypothetical protein
VTCTLRNGESAVGRSTDDGVAGRCRDPGCGGLTAHVRDLGGRPGLDRGGYSFLSGDGPSPVGGGRPQTARPDSVVVSDPAGRAVAAAPMVAIAAFALNEPGWWRSAGRDADGAHRAAV